MRQIMVGLFSRIFLRDIGKIKQGAIGTSWRIWNNQQFLTVKIEWASTYSNNPFFAHSCRHAVVYFQAPAIIDPLL